jgi:hypothetical protein
MHGRPDLDAPLVVLIVPSWSPNGIGIGQYGIWVWAITDCCSARVVWEVVDDESCWICDSCERVIASASVIPRVFPTNSGMTLDQMSDEEFLEWVCGWTGFDPEKIRIER